MQAPASKIGWYPCPDRSGYIQYWSGKAWSEEVVLARTSDTDGLVQAKRWVETAAGSNAHFWGSCHVIGTVSDPACAVAQNHARPGEQPWLALSPGGATGVLVAYDDRLMIIKTGLLTSWLAGSLGGGRVTTFPFAEITGIEFNGQLLTGVLEVLTASYSGTQNHDHWRGTGAGRNADSGDPYTLSNTLPMARSFYQEAMPQINELRDRIIKAKNPTLNVQVSGSTGAPSAADELAKLAALRAQGVLTEAEFTQMKNRVMNAN